MKKLARITMLMVLALTLLVPTAASAQEEMPCFGLSAPDCELFYRDEPFDSASMALTFHLSVSGIEEAEVEIDVAGTGNFTVDPEAVDPLAGFNMDIALDITATAEGQTESLPIEFRMIDGNFYMNMAELGGWVYMPLADAMAMGDMPFDPSMLMGAEMMDEAAMMEIVGPLMGVLENNMTFARGADIDVKGNTVATFSGNIDLQGMFADPGLGNAIVGLLEAMGPEVIGAEMSEAEMQEMTQMLPMVMGMVGMFFADSSLTIESAVGVDNGYSYGFGVGFNVNIEPTMIAMITGETAPPGAETIAIAFEIGVDLADHNAQFEYMVPEGATEMPMGF